MEVLIIASLIIDFFNFNMHDKKYNLQATYNPQITTIEHVGEKKTVFPVFA